MFYDVHLLPPSRIDDPHAALVRHAAEDLAEQHEHDPPVIPLEVLSKVRETWVKPGEGLRIEDSHGAVTVRLPFWYWGRQAREQAKVLHAVVKELEAATGWRGFDAVLVDWVTGRSYLVCVGVLEGVAVFLARDRLDTRAVVARGAGRAADGGPMPVF